MFLGSCNTIDGPNPDKPCIFPFYWRGKTYNGKLLGIDRKFDLAELWLNFGRTSAELSDKHKVQKFPTKRIAEL